MFEMHMGDDLSVKSSTVQSPLLVLGNAGQGKTVFLLQFVLELIRNNQHGMIYDPFGDLAKTVDEHVQSDEMQRRVAMTSAALYADETVIKTKNGFLVVAGNCIEEGAVATRQSGQKVIAKALKEIDHDGWLIIDEASDFLNDEIFEAYIRGGGARLVLSDQTLIRYSSRQRGRLLRAAKQIVLYKTRNFDGQCVQSAFGKPTAKDIAAIKQYHYYWIDGERCQYTKSPWPIDII
jgi:KaiC/GvpD/RAD55 family RecA-like ATPase